MSTSYSNFFNNSNGFGINVKKSETTPQKHVEQQVQQNSEFLSNFLKPVEKIVGTVKDVFNGNVADELNRYRALNFNTELILHEADVKVNGQKPVFDMKF
jgi:hypothetical protein